MRHTRVYHVGGEECGKNTEYIVVTRDASEGKNRRHLHASKRKKARYNGASSFTAVARSTATRQRDFLGALPSMLDLSVGLFNHLN
jgi:hypothetical protein